MKLLFFSLMCLLTNHCGIADKNPVDRNADTFVELIGHWFANEKTLYVFWYVEGASATMLGSRFAMRFSDRQSNAFTPWQMLSGSDSVHPYTPTRCDGAHCRGSFTRHVDQAPNALEMRLLYENGERATDQSSFIETHEKKDISGYSALVYGVYADRKNTLIQAQLFHNFGHPSHQTISKYGFTRNWHTQIGASISLNDANGVAQKAANPFFYPATQWCDGNTPTTTTHPGGQIADDALANDGNGGHCLHVTFTDKDQNTILTAAAIARKNPVVSDFKLQISGNPQPAEILRLYLQHCNTDFHRHDEYLAFQKHVTGMQASDEGPCYSPDKIDTFTTSLNDRLTTLIDNARSGDRDFVITLALHHNLVRLDTRFQALVFQTLLAHVDVGLLSPRFAGIAVFDSSSAFQKPHEDPRQAYIDWRSEDIVIPEFRIAGVSLLPPSGPFSSRTAFIKFREQWSHDAFIGIHRPSLAAKTLPVDALQNVHLFPGWGWASFLHQTRIEIQQGEKFRVCREGDDRDRIVLWQGNDDALSLSDFALSQAIRDQSGVYSVGLIWEAPFALNLSFSEPTGVKLNFPVYPVPLTFNEQRSTRNLGADIWNRNLLVDIKMQRCTAFCHHPYFDKQGVYQIHQRWDSRYDSCENSRFILPQ